MTMDQAPNPVGAPMTLVDAIENISNVQHQLEDMELDNIPSACDSPFTPVSPAGKRESSWIGDGVEDSGDVSDVNSQYLSSDVRPPSQTHGDSDGLAMVRNQTGNRPRGME